MFKVISSLLVAFLIQPAVEAQEVPDLRLSTLEGSNFQTAQFNNKGNIPIVLSFWATWCIPCITELSAINENFEDWKKELTFEFYAVSEDDSRTSQRVQPLIRGKGWNFTVLLDKNQDMKRLLNLPNFPYTLIVKNGKIIYRHQGYAPGQENELYRVLKENQ